jgi:hypothetical protein
VEDAAQSLAALEATWGEQYPYLFAQSHAMTGNREAAFAWLERSADALPIDVAFPHLSPAMTVLHDDPRWSEILERFGLSPRQLQCVELDVALPALEAD